MGPEDSNDASVTDADQQNQQQGDDQQQSTGEPAGPTVEDITRLKTALDRERAASRTNAAAARELTALKASQQSDTEKAIHAAREEASREVSAKYTARIAGLSVRAAAGGKLRDPEDAVAHLRDRLGDFVGDDGEVDDKAVSAAVDQLLKARPYLGVEKAPADFDGGQRSGTSGTKNMNDVIRRSVGL
jgi:hypothetical protein